MSLDSRVRGNDENGQFLTLHEFINIPWQETQKFLEFKITTGYDVGE